MVDLSLLGQLLDGAQYLGGAYDVGYDRWTVVTNDTYKERCGGVPRHGFLLATRITPRELEQADYSADDEVVLLQVRGNTRLPNENDLIATRLEAIQNVVSPRRGPLDPTTKAAVEKSALDCAVLGTFYLNRTPLGNPCVRWGSDLDTTYAGVNYLVYRPGVDALSYIASYPERTDQEIDSGTDVHTIPLGVVRFASTRRRSEVSGLAKAEVRVRVSDFISRKTAVLGMTRAGKSNTNKTICTAVFEHSHLSGTKVGQIIFDPQGEYANPNGQDGTSLRYLGENHVRIYKMSPDPSSSQEKPITYNFYDPANTEIAHQFCCEAIDQAGTSGAAYTAGFLSVSMTPPEPGASPQDVDEHNKAVFALYALLARAGFDTPTGWKGISFRMAGALAAAILNDHPNALAMSSTSRGVVTISTRDGLIDTMHWVCRAVEAVLKGGKELANSPYRGLEAELRTWTRADKKFGQIREVFQREGATTAAAKRLAAIREYHSPSATGKVEDHILGDLRQGRIVIVDLSIGSETVVTLMSDRIAKAILDNANDLFRNNQPTMPVQILVEEAHRLFDRTNVSSRAVDPWVRLAKEAAKYEIGLQYATQEVSSIDERILSQTHNWVVAHLNSVRETQVLGHYYGYSDYADDLRRVEDIGFVRLKTLSGRYIVPTQVAKFDHTMINRARKAAGLGPIGPDGEPLDDEDDR